MKSAFLFAFVFLLVAIVSIKAASSSSSSCTSYKGICQADWMSKLPPQIQNKNIKEILVLGSHDTGAQAPLNFAATPPCEHTKIFNTAIEFAKNKFTAPLIVPLLDDLTITQPLNVFQQLEQGIRSFDLRISWSNITNTFYLSHSFMAQPLIDTLADIQKFLVLHPGEVLFIQAEYDYEHADQTSPKVSEIFSLLYKYLGDSFNSNCHKISSPNMTLANAVASNKRIFFDFDETFDSQKYPSVCSGRMMDTYWPNGQNSTQSIGRIKKYLAEKNLTANTDTFNLVFFTVTDDTESIIEDILQDIFKTHHFIGLKQWSANIRPLAWEVLDNFIQVEKRRGISIVSVDFPTDEYVQKIINWNLNMTTMLN